jgi:hypothetical protein
MLTVGKKSPWREIAYVKHELLDDVEVTKFSISDTVADKSGKPIAYIGKDGKEHNLLVYYVVTVFDNIPLVETDRIRLLTINNLAQCQITSEYTGKDGTKRPQFKRCYSFSATIDKVAWNKKKKG